MKTDAAVRALFCTEDLARRRSVIHARHPVAKLMAALFYVVALVGVDRWSPLSLTPFVLFPAAVWILSGLPAAPLMRRLAIVLPFLTLMGVINPIVNRTPLPGHLLSAGWLSCITLITKGILAAAAMLLFISTTGIDGLARALRILRVPRVLVQSLCLTYRYLSLLAEEAGRVSTAYALRAPRAKGIRFPVWGSLCGHMLLRAFDRAGRVHDAMLLRGFDGQYRAGAPNGFRGGDVFYLGAVAAYCLAVRLIDIPSLLGGAFA